MKKTRIQIFSDIHLEAYGDQFHKLWSFVTPKAPVAIVAGDIHSKRFEGALTEIASKFKQVIAVYGNHEWYGRNISWRADKNLLPDNVHVLDRDIYEHEGIVFIGVTLWTDFKNQDWFVMCAAKTNINDFHIIRSNGPQHVFTPNMAIDHYMKDKAYLKMMIENFRQQNKKIVVVTHFMPSYEVVAPRWKANPGSDTLNYYFSAQCEDVLFMEGIDCWVHGHSHDAYDKKIADVRIVRNPLGYPNENLAYKDKVILV